MSEVDSGLKQNHAWRSKFRSRAHEQAHDQSAAASAVECTHAMVYRGKPDLIENDEALFRLIERLREAGSFAFDSEFIGELSYVPRLCLIQIATSREIALIDPLANLDLMPFWQLLADSSVEKIVHAGAQDVEPVTRHLERPAAGVVDTQIAAGFAHLPYPISLRRLVLQTLDVKLGKGLTFSHWDQRPLSAQQLRYAADDVRYLPAVWAQLKTSLHNSQKLEWIAAECEAMCHNSPYQFDPHGSYLRVRGAGTLDGRGLGVLLELARWRDAAARAADLPPRTFLRDEILIELCRKMPETLEQLQKIQGLPRTIRAGHETALLQCIVEGRTNPVAEQPGRKSDELPQVQFDNDALHAIAQSICAVQGIDPQLALTRSDVAELRRNLDNGQELAGLRIMQTWRRNAVGDALVAVATGSSRIALGREKASWVFELPGTHNPCN